MLLKYLLYGFLEQIITKYNWTIHWKLFIFILIIPCLLFYFLLHMLNHKESVVLVSRWQVNFIAKHSFPSNSNTARFFMQSTPLNLSSQCLGGSWLCTLVHYFCVLVITCKQSLKQWVIYFAETNRNFRELVITQRVGEKEIE